MKTMKAVVFKGKDRIAIEEVPKPTPRAGEAVIRITTTTICGTDVHIVRGEYPVKPGLVLGHEPVGVIEELGAGLDELYTVGQRVIVGAITPCGQCFYCLNGVHSQCGGALGGWRFGNTINGAWAEYLLVPDARANLAPIPDGLTDEDVVLCPDIFSTGLSGAESGNISVGDAVAVFAQGPIGLCATLGAKLQGRVAHHRRRLESTSGSRWRAGSAPTSRSTSEDGDPVAGDQTADRRPRRRRRDRGARTPGDVRERAARDPARRHALEPRRVLRASSSRRTRRSTRASATRRSSRRSVPGGKERMRRLMAMVAHRSRRSDAARHPPVRARRHPRGVRPVQPSAGRRAEGRALSGCESRERLTPYRGHCGSHELRGIMTRLIRLPSLLPCSSGPLQPAPR